MRGRVPSSRRASPSTECSTTPLGHLALALEARVWLEGRDHVTARRLIVESVELELKQGDRVGLVFNLETCAGLAAAEGRHERAVRLYAGASVLRESIGAIRTTSPGPTPRRGVAPLRDALGEEAFAEAWAKGRAMRLDESLDYALGGRGRDRHRARATQPVSRSRSRPSRISWSPNSNSVAPSGLDGGEVLFGSTLSAAWARVTRAGKSLSACDRRPRPPARPDPRARPGREPDRRHRGGRAPVRDCSSKSSGWTSSCSTSGSRGRRS